MDKIKRAHWHDYHSRCIYMITLKKRKGTPDFGMLMGDPRLPLGHNGAPCIRAGITGNAIKAVQREIHLIEPKLRILQYALMPDHHHLLLEVTSPTEEHLGNIIARFKVAVNDKAGYEVFETGYNDQILKPTRRLDSLFHYLRDNARRLAVRRANPDWFRRRDAVRFGEQVCQTYGNLHLLLNPFKEAVTVHRVDSEAQFKQNCDNWLYTVANGGVAVSPFISQREKQARQLIEEAGGRIILITDRPFPERYKPAEHDFGLCEQGRLLIISIGAEAKALHRATCLAMNRLASHIASAPPTFPT